MADVSSDLQQAFYPDVVMIRIRKSPNPYRGAFMVLAALLLAAVGSTGTGERTAAAGMMDKSCCRVPAGRTCCCCAAPAPLAVGVVPASSAPSSRAITPRAADLEAVGIPASCRCTADAPANPAPKPGTPSRIGRPVPSLDLTVHGQGRIELTRPCCLAGPGSRSAAPPPSPLSLRTTPLLI